VTVRTWFRGMRTVDHAARVDYLLTHAEGADWLTYTPTLTLIFNHRRLQLIEAVRALIQQETRALSQRHLLD
jgi:hypothetical protein